MVKEFSPAELALSEARDRALIALQSLYDVWEMNQVSLISSGFVRKGSTPLDVLSTAKELKRTLAVSPRPSPILAVFDRPEKSDRYTVILAMEDDLFKEQIRHGTLRGVCVRPEYPCLAIRPSGGENGIESRFGLCTLGAHLGKVVAWESLPYEVSSYIDQRITKPEDEA